MYLLDANVLIQAHEDYYPLDRVPQFWDWLLDMAKTDQLKMAFEIHGEIAVSNGALKDWICSEDVKNFLILDEQVNLDLVNDVIDTYGAALTDADIEKMGQDPFLIAYALANADRIVVTKEISKPTAQKGNRKIPDVCNDLGVKWTRDFEMYKLLNFTTAKK